MFKLPMYVIFLIGAIVVPVLTKVCNALKKRAEVTPEEWDDVMVGALEAVIEFLKSPGVFEPKK
jgi:hypothetical protein